MLVLVVSIHPCTVSLLASVETAFGNIIRNWYVYCWLSMLFPHKYFSFLQPADKRSTQIVHVVCNCIHVFFFHFYSQQTKDQFRVQGKQRQGWPTVDWRGKFIIIISWVSRKFGDGIADQSACCQEHCQYSVVWSVHSRKHGLTQLKGRKTVPHLRGFVSEELVS